MRKGPRIVDGSPRRPCSRVVVLRVPEAVADAMAARAQQENVTAASIARRTLADAFTGDPADRQPALQYRPARPGKRKASPDIVALAGLREAVGEATGTLRQVAGLDRARGGARLHELDSAITRLIAAAARLDEMKAAAEEGS